MDGSEGMVITTDPGIEQPKKGVGGRPVGTKAIWSKDARIELAKAGFNPIEKMIKLHDEIEARIKVLSYNEDGTIRERAPNLVIATLYNTLQKISNDLMRYGYYRTPETNIVENKPLGPVQVILTEKGYEPPPVDADDLSDVPAELIAETEHTQE